MKIRQGCSPALFRVAAVLLCALLDWPAQAWADASSAALPPPRTPWRPPAGIAHPLAYVTPPYRITDPLFEFDTASPNRYQ